MKNDCFSRFSKFNLKPIRKIYEIGNSYLQPHQYCWFQRFIHRIKDYQVEGKKTLQKSNAVKKSWAKLIRIVLYFTYLVDQFLPRIFFYPCQIDMAHIFFTLTRIKIFLRILYLKSEEKKMRHVQKLTDSKKSTFFVVSSWNLVKIFTSLVFHFYHVS